MKRLLTTKEAAEYLLMSPSTLLQEVRKGRLRGYKPAGRWKFYQQDLDDYVQKHVVSGQDFSQFEIGDRDLWRYTKEEISGGSTLRHPMANEYDARLKLATKKQHKSTTTD